MTKTRSTPKSAQMYCGISIHLLSSTSHYRLQVRVFARKRQDGGLFTPRFGYHPRHYVTVALGGEFHDRKADVRGEILLGLGWFVFAHAAFTQLRRPSRLVFARSASPTNSQKRTLSENWTISASAPQKASDFQ